MWKSDNVTVVKGAEQLKRFSVRNAEMGRYFCAVRAVRMSFPLRAQCKDFHAPAFVAIKLIVLAQGERVKLLL